MVGRARGIVDVLEQSVQAGLIAQRQNDIQAHGLTCGKASEGLHLVIADHISHMVRQEILRRDIWRGQKSRSDGKDGAG